MSVGETDSAGRRTTSTPSISGSVAPDSAALNISWQNGDGCGGRSVMSCSFVLVQPHRGPHRLPRPAAVPRVVVGTGQPVPTAPIVRVVIQFGPDGVKQRIGGISLEAPGGPPG